MAGKTIKVKVDGELVVVSETQARVLERGSWTEGELKEVTNRGAQVLSGLVYKELVSFERNKIRRTSRGTQVNRAIRRKRDQE